MKHLVLLALLLQGCSCVSPDLIAARRLPPAFTVPPRLPVPLPLPYFQPGSTSTLRPSSTLGGALGLHALDRGNDQGDRRSALKSAVQLGQLVLGGMLAPGAARAEEGPPPQVVPRRRRGSNPFGYREVQERLVSSILKQDPGGFLFSEAFIKTDTKFPDWIAGEWLVRSTIDQVQFPLGTKYKPVEGDLCVGMKENWSPMGPCFLPDGKAEEGREVYYKFKFQSDLGGVHRDHAFNFASIVENYALGFNTSDVAYNRKAKTLTAKLKSPQGIQQDTEVSIRKIRGFGTARCPLCSTFVCWDLLDSSVASQLNRGTQVRRFEIITSYHIADSQDDSDEGGSGGDGVYGDTIEALQRIACYLGPSDEWYEETKGVAVALIDLKLLMRRVDLDEGFE